ISSSVVMSPASYSSRRITISMRGLALSRAMHRRTASRVTPASRASQVRPVGVLPRRGPASARSPRGWRRYSRAMRSRSATPHLRAGGLGCRGSVRPGLAVPAPGVVLPQDYAAFAGDARLRLHDLPGRVDRAAALAFGGGTALDRYERGVAAVALAATDAGD